MGLEEKPNWSKSAVDRLGNAIREGNDYDENFLDDFLDWHAGLIDIALELLHPRLKEYEADLSALPPNIISLIPSRHLDLSFRPKTIDTLQQKLQRMPNTRLSQVQDIAGLRLDGFITLDHQQEVAERLCALFEAHGASKAEDRSTVQNPHNGYRAVHIHVNSPAGRLEIQLRTHGQSTWANLYESAADIVGREIRYEQSFPDSRQELMERLFALSNQHFILDQLVSESVQLHIGAAELAGMMPIKPTDPERISRLLEQSANIMEDALLRRSTLSQETQRLRETLLGLSS